MQANNTHRETTATRSTNPTPIPPQTHSANRRQARHRRSLSEPSARRLELAFDADDEAGSDTSSEEDAAWSPIASRRSSANTAASASKAGSTPASGRRRSIEWNQTQMLGSSTVGEVVRALVRLSAAQRHQGHAGVDNDVRPTAVRRPSCHPADVAHCSCACPPATHVTNRTRVRTI